MPRAVVRVVLVSSGGGGPQIMDATQVLVYTVKISLLSLSPSLSVRILIRSF